MTQGEKVGRDAPTAALYGYFLDAIGHDDAMAQDEAGRFAAHLMRDIRAGKVQGVALKTHDGTTCWQCEKCGKTRTGRGCMVCLEKEVSELRERLAQSERECMEQARLNGMGSEREARLMAEVAELRGKAGDLSAECNDLKTEVEADLVRIGHLYSYIKELEAERDEARGLLPKWIRCSERLPECKEPCESMWGGTARSDTCLVLYADDPKHWDEPGPHISTGFLLDYSDGEEKCFEWMYPIDRTGGLERCSSHGGPVPIAWMPLPEGTAP